MSGCDSRATSADAVKRRGGSFDDRIVQAEIALSGVIGALSYALDITEGQPAGHAVRSA